jgi:hypothetical protein
MGADQVTYGPPAASGQNFNQKALVLDQTNGVLYVSGNNRKFMTAMGAPLVLPAQTALVTITTAQTLLSFIFGAGALNVIGRKIRVKGRAIYTPTATPGTITLALILGGVTLATIVTANTGGTATAGLQLNFEFELTVVTLGATATIEAHGIAFANLTTATTGVSSVYTDVIAAVSSAVNLTAAATVAVTIAASAAVTSAQLRSATVMYEA